MRIGRLVGGRERGRSDARRESRGYELGGQPPGIRVHANPGRGDHPPSAACAAYFFFGGVCPFFSSCPITEAARVRVCAGVGLIAPDKTLEASVETGGVDCFLAMIKFLSVVGGGVKPLPAPIAFSVQGLSDMGHFPFGPASGGVVTASLCAMSSWRSPISALAFGARTSIARSNSAQLSSTSSFFAISKKRADCPGSVVRVLWRFFFGGGFGLLAGMGRHSALAFAELLKQLSYKSAACPHTAQKDICAFLILRCRSLSGCYSGSPNLVRAGKTILTKYSVGVKRKFVYDLQRTRLNGGAMNGRYIIAKFGGQSALARLMGRKQSTVSYWAQKDEIPGRWWPQLIALAREYGVELTMADFISSHEPPPPEAESAANVNEADESLGDVVPVGSDQVEVGGDSHFLFYQADKGDVQVRVFLEQETVWVSQRGMAEIFDVTVQNVSSHLQNIFRDNELDQSVIKKSLITASDGKSYDTTLYNLDAIISVGYRVNSYNATQFRRWATGVLKSYMIKGFALDDERLKQGKALFGKDYFDELLERIREIRASERRFYQKITDLFASSIDYDKNSPICNDFYAHIQDKIHFAVAGKTSAELIESRADATKPNMGLQSWKNEKRGGKITKLDVTIGKNYLVHDEMDDMNRLVSMCLDFAENFARRRIPLAMKDWATKIDEFLAFNAYAVLDGYGVVQREAANRKAVGEYEKFRVIQDREYKSDFDRVADEIRTKKRLPKTVERIGAPPKETSN